MSVITAYAPGKIILFGEHAVVYGQPALAVPLSSIRAAATVSDAAPGSGLAIQALDLDKQFSLSGDQPLALMARLVLRSSRCAGGRV